MVQRSVCDVDEWTIVPPLSSLTFASGAGGCEVLFSGGKFTMRPVDLMLWTPRDTCAAVQTVQGFVGLMQGCASRHSWAEMRGMRKKMRCNGSKKWTLHRIEKQLFEGGRGLNSKFADHWFRCLVQRSCRRWAKAPWLHRSHSNRQGKK